MSQRGEMAAFERRLARLRRTRSPVLPDERARARRAEEKRERRRRRNLASARLVSGTAATEDSAARLVSSARPVTTRAVTAEEPRGA